MIKKENLIAKNVRLEPSKWEELERIAEKETLLRDNVTIRTSDLIRHAVDNFISNY